VNIEIDKLLVNRSSLTLKMGIAGLPIMQMVTHIPYFDNIIKNKIDSKDKAYNTILENSKLFIKKENVNLVESIKREGIKKPITGYLLNNKVEIYGGHHRAVCAYLLGIKSIPIEFKTLEVFNNKSNIHLLHNAYTEASKTEAIRVGHSYNPVPGLISVRKGVDRIKLLYEDMINCRGDELIDLGCNDGYFGIFFSQHSFKPTFVDKSSAYINIVQTKLKMLELKSDVICSQIFPYMKYQKTQNKHYCVALYLDVFYHTVIEQSLKIALQELESIMSISKKVYFAPGRWDKLKGFSEKSLFEWVLNKNKRLRYIGKDTDGKAYEREIYCIE